MSLVLRKIGRRRYAYRAERRNGKVRHIYLGPERAEETQARIREILETQRVPERFRSLFWDVRLDDVDLRRHKRYVIARVLDVGHLEEFEWLTRIYAGELIRRVNRESRAVSPMSKNFWRIWFRE